MTYNIIRKLKMDDGIMPNQVFDTAEYRLEDRIWAILGDPLSDMFNHGIALMLRSAIWEQEVV